MCVVMISRRTLSGSGRVHSQYSPVMTGVSTGAPWSWCCSCWDYSPRNWAAHLLRKGFLDHACFLSYLHAPPLYSSLPLPLLSLAPSSWLLSLAPRAMPACWWYCSFMEGHICQQLLLSHRGFLTLGLRFCSQEQFI